MADAPFRWGLLGASRVAAKWLLPAVHAEPGHVAAAIGARDGRRAGAYAAEQGIARAVEGYEPVLADPEIDAVYVGLTNDAHVNWTVRALEAGKHVLCEKPLALNAAEVERMIAAEARSGCRVLEAFAYRFHPQIDRLLVIIASGRLGRLVWLESSVGAQLPAEDQRCWSPTLGGGALLDLGCYAVNLARLAAGREPVRVAAVADMQRGVDATLTGLLDFGDGLSASVACSFVAAREQQFVARGTDGIARLRIPFSGKGREVAIELDGETERFPPCDPAQPMIAHFAAAARGEQPLRWPLAEALAQARTLDALFGAASSGTAMPVIANSSRPGH
ncbi:MAG TPA: Gfo/Idh/MocA family oxidoreductase [Acetobacteraceae bacterium]|nr:Gfo/Idh/MocA family oxidoreductase [Acetobacteraceae bacterium]